MALVHEKLYRSQDLARIDFADYVRNLATYLVRSYSANSGLIDLKVNADDIFQSIDKAVPCGLIINELVSNSLKYAFPNGQGGEIHIGLHIDDKDMVTLVIGDNGIGFPADADFHNTTSLGLKLVNILVNQLDGTIELENDHGTELKITFPK
jgi:two-component sensor histidine kinase